jgi:hypothetical protein
MYIIYKNRNPAGHLWNAVFAFALLADAIIRILSLFQLATSLPTIASREMVRYHIKNLKKLRDKQNA